MGQVFGRTGVAEPAFDVLYKHAEPFSYEVRKYGTRYAAKATYGGSDDDSSPFMVLARYIGVFGTPENEGKESIAMTAPVVRESKSKGKGGTAIAMTAPVIKTEGEGGEKIMEFILPAKYNSMEGIPQPTNPQVKIVEVPPAVGVVHVYRGSMQDDKAQEIARQLALQLRKDGLDEMTEESVLERFQYWGYNPPFTLPMFRRNEVWVGLDENEVSTLVNGGVSISNAN